MSGVFLLGLSLLFLHEMDAVRCHEWRIFPGLSLLKERTGFLVFMALHVPLFIVVVSALENPGFRKGFDGFLILHFGLHLLFLRHPRNEFKDWISWMIISAAALCGALDLVTLA